MRRALEIIAGRWPQLLALLIVPLLIASAVVYLQPRTYQATASLLAMQRYYVIGATGLESDLQATPAETQATAITELLQTREYSLAVANEANMAEAYPASVRADQTTLNDDMYADLTKNVVATPLGYSVLTISYTNKSPDLATRVVAAIIDQYGKAAGQFSVAEGQQLKVIYDDQLQQAQTTANNASGMVSSYLRTHPGATVLTDPTYNALVSQATSAQNNVNAIQGTISQLNQEIAAAGTGSNTLFKIVDKAATPGKPASRTKSLLLDMGVGVGVGLLVIALYLIIVMRRDRSPYTSDDLQRLFEAPVLLELPLMPAKVAAQAIDRPANNALTVRRHRARR